MRPAHGAEGPKENPREPIPTRGGTKTSEHDARRLRRAIEAGELTSPEVAKLIATGAFPSTEVAAWRSIVGVGAHVRRGTPVRAYIRSQRPLSLAEALSRYSKVHAEEPDEVTGMYPYLVENSSEEER